MLSFPFAVFLFFLAGSLSKNFFARTQQKKKEETYLVHGPSDLGGSFGRRVPPFFFKTLDLKKKSGGHLSVVAFGSERPLTRIFILFETFSLQRLTRLLRALVSSNYKN